MEIKNRINMLNVLKIISFLCIFLLHMKLFMPVTWNENIRFAWLLYTPAWAGVWLFIFLSGYGIGIGFEKKKYSCTINGIFRFYIQRIKKIIPLYLFYIFVVSVFVCPEILTPTKMHFQQLLSLIFFNYQEEFNSLEFGLAWYLTTLIRLYVISPFVFMFINKFGKKIPFILKIVMVVVLGFVFRFSMGYHIGFSDSWVSSIYKPWYFNVDIFTVGMLMGHLKTHKQITIMKTGLNKIFSITVFSFVLLVILINSYLYYYGKYANNVSYMFVYYYFMPSIYILCGVLYTFCFDVCNNHPCVVRGTAIFAKFINGFTTIQFPLYLFHSTIILKLCKSFDLSQYTKLIQMVNIPNSYASFSISCILSIVVLLLSILWANMIKPITKMNFSPLDRVANLDIEGFLKKLKNTFLKILKLVAPEKSN